MSIGASCTVYCEEQMFYSDYLLYPFCIISLTHTHKSPIYKLNKAGNPLLRTKENIFLTVQLMRLYDSNVTKLSLVGQNDDIAPGT